MSETNPKGLINNEGNLREIVGKSPDHPFARIVKKVKEKGKDVYTYTIHYGLQAGVIGKSLLTLGAKFGMVDVETHNSIIEAMKPLPLDHITNMGASYAIVGVSVAAAEFTEGVLAAANRPKAAKFINKALPAIGAISAVGVNLFVESRHIVPWDTLDQNDALLGVAIIVPGYFAARHFLSKNFHLRERGVTFMGKLSRKVQSPSDVIRPEELSLSEIKNITDNSNREE